MSSAAKHCMHDGAQCFFEPVASQLAIGLHRPMVVSKALRCLIIALKARVALSCLMIYKSPSQPPPHHNRHGRQTPTAASPRTRFSPAQALCGEYGHHRMLVQRMNSGIAVLKIRRFLRMESPTNFLRKVPVRSAFPSNLALTYIS